jgi:hypothetical protein
VSPTVWPRRSVTCRSRGSSRSSVPTMQPEARLRARCALYLKAALPEPGTYTAIEHGRVHAGTPEQRAREWSRLKSQGVRAGIMDLLVLFPGLFFSFELKVGKNTMSDKQEDWAASIAACGFIAREIRSVEALHDTLVSHGIPIAPSMRTLAMSHDACLSTPAPAKNRAAPRAPAATKPTASAIARSHAMRARTFF